MNDFPQDEFDKLASERGSLGAHRAPTSSRKKWWLALLAVVIVMPLLGVAFGYFYSTQQAAPVQSVVSTPASQAPSAQASAPASLAPAEQSSAAPSVAESSPSPAESSAPADVNKAASVMLLNGKGVKGYAAQQQKALAADGFTNIEIGNYAKGTPAGTTVFYRDASLKSTADAVAAKFGGEAVESAAAVGAGGQIVVVLR
ncbi:cytoskeletal protein RodZ [Arcanobacterium wilhelmae]|uniref:Cytoskeletal protein RodZ n=1 Tax=Arcanobacterium wilhelmae TaxID=1803177 RepID=A0ABT9NCC0_9ACTO|nr:LytR C-terminal domain-containing protein [Arcanobacterium wilhelmae]MDP9801153.1 cytoskeletal protein RodZ [Arcanobacterium wilhelmae]WFN90505.1 LytR C-terminal domain-containing protein [Arcanobacterium wilhelmae]